MQSVYRICAYPVNAKRTSFLPRRLRRYARAYRAKVTKTPGFPCCNAVFPMLIWFDAGVICQFSDRFIGGVHGNPKKLENNRAKLTIGVSPEAFGAAVQKAYQQTAKRYNVPGFRKGKAPRKVIENMYGEGAFYEEAFELVWGEAYDAALAEHKLTAVDKPSLDIATIGSAEGVTFTAEVQLKPEVTLGAYTKLEVPEPDFAVSDEAVMAEIEKEREKNARFIEVDRAVENGDRVILDYSGSVDGEKFEGGTAEDQLLVIGSGSFIPGFEEQLVGLKAGDEKDINVKFPDEYSRRWPEGRRIRHQDQSRTGQRAARAGRRVRQGYLGLRHVRSTQGRQARADGGKSGQKTAQAPSRTSRCRKRRITPSSTFRT
ncbi:MAG: trigger factor [Eubacteriales bacterium]